MKFLPVLITFCAVLSVASAADLGSRAVSASSSMKTEVESKPETKTQTRRLEDEPWDNGTKVYNEFANEGWWSGTISSYSKTTGMYTVTWEDGSTDFYEDDDKIDQMVAYAQNDPQNNAAGATSVAGAYPVGTEVSYYEDDQWYDGVVVQYGSGTYTIEWDEDNEMEQVEAGPEFDQMVEDAYGDDDSPPDGYDGGPSRVEIASSPSVSVGADVSYYENGGWIDGRVTDYSNGIYTVVWDDGSNDTYDDSGDDLVELQQAVLDAVGDDDAPPDAVSGPKFPNGTPVSDWEDEGWVDGEVVGFENGSYVVQWDDEDDTEYYDSHNAENMQELKQMADDAIGDDDAPPDSYFASEDLWEIGTPVAVKEDGVQWYGKINGFRNGEYSVAWDNGDSEYLDNFDIVNQMVSNAALEPKKSGMSGVGKVFLSLFIISICAVGSVFGYKFFQKYQATQKRERQLSAEDGGDLAFQERPDNLPKII